jgi:hypothetical protein
MQRNKCIATKNLCTPERKNNEYYAWSIGRQIGGSFRQSRAGAHSHRRRIKGSAIPGGLGDLGIAQRPQGAKKSENSVGSNRKPCRRDVLVAISFFFRGSGAGAPSYTGFARSEKIGLCRLSSLEVEIRFLQGRMIITNRITLSG